MVSTPSRLSEPSTASLICSDRLFRPRCSPLGPKSKPNLVAITTCSRRGGQRFAHQLLVRERAVHFSRIEEGDAALDGRTNQGDQLLLIWRRPVALAHAHAAEPDGRDFQVAVSE